MAKTEKSTKRETAPREQRHRVLRSLKVGFIVSLGTTVILPQEMSGTQTELSIGDIRTRLSNCEREGGDTQINGRIGSLKTILNMSGVYNTFTPYKLQQLSDLIGDASGPDTSLYKLYKDGPTETVTRGYPGAFPGEITAYGRLNLIMEIILQSAIFVQFGDATDTPLESGKTLWSRLNWVVQTPTVLQNALLQGSIQQTLAQMKTLQACLHGAVGLLDATTMETMLGKASTPASAGTLAQMNDALTALQHEISQSAASEGEETGSDPMSKVPAFQEPIQTTYKAVAKKVGGIEINRPTFTGTFIEPPRFSDSFQTVQNLLKTLNPTDPQTAVPFLDLTPIVRALTYNWPFLMTKIETAGATPIQNIYTGSFIAPGLTLLNCLSAVTKTLNLNDLLNKIGRPDAAADSTTLWGILQQQKANAGGVPPPELEAAKEALTLVFQLLENVPALGEVITNSTTLTTALNSIVDGPEDAQTKARALRAKLNDYCMAFLPTDIARPNNTERTLFPYETLFALLLNHSQPLSEALFPSIRTALYATPLVYEIEGTTYPIEKTAWVTQLAALSGGGSVNDFWGSLIEPTACSITKALSHVIAKSGEMMPLRIQEKTLAEICQDNIQTAGASGGGSVNRTAFYEQMTAPFRQLINDVLGSPADAENGTASSGLYQTAETAFPKQETDGTSEEPAEDSSLLKTFQDKLRQLKEALDCCSAQAYPVDFSAVYTNLIQAQSALSTQIGHATDHYLDVTAFGRVNGALFESGAQLLLNLIGQITDPGQPDYGTLNAKLREIKCSGTSNASEIAAVRTKVNSLQGRIRYAFVECLASTNEGATFPALVSALHSGSVPKWHSWTSGDFAAQATFLDTCITLLTPTSAESGE